MPLSGWIDSHAHLADLDKESLNKNLATCSENNVLKVINSSTDIKSARIIANQIKNHPALFGTAGISPFDTERVEKGWQEQLTDLLTLPKMIALGEIGLDKTNPTYPAIELQREIFLEQLNIAEKQNIPVIVHSRGSEEDVLRHLIERKISKAIFHCYTGPAELIKDIVKQGFYISYSGIVTFNKAPLNEQVINTPLTNIFIETDSPYLAPAPYRGKKNEPAFVALVGEKIASLKEVTVDALQERILENFKKLFNIFPY